MANASIHFVKGKPTNPVGSYFTARIILILFYEAKQTDRLIL